MEEHAESADSKPEMVVEEVSEEIQHRDLSSSSSSESEAEKPAPPSPAKTKVFRLFGREKPVHAVLGGRKPADVFLWRNKKISASFLVGATATWVLFELLEYHLLTLVCHIMILALALLFIWSNALYLINKTPPRTPEVHLPEGPFLEFASALATIINQCFAVLHDIASGRNMKKFLTVIAGLWILSVGGNCVNFLTLLYITFVLLHTLPVLYEKYEDKVDPFVEKMTIAIKKQYAAFDAKVLSKVSSKIPKGPLKGKMS